MTYAKRTDENHRDVVDDAVKIASFASRVITTIEREELMRFAESRGTTSSPLCARLLEDFKSYLPQ